MSKSGIIVKNNRNPWAILAIDPTDDARAIRKAYNKAVHMHHPEEDPDGFMMVREAYEKILKLLEHSIRVPSGNDIPVTVFPSASADESDIAPYFQEAYALYHSFWDRIQKSKWKQLFLSMNFEFYDMFKANAGLFFNECYHLPTDVWRYLNEKFYLPDSKRFIRQSAYQNQLDFTFRIFTPDITWDYEKYIELRYQGACAQAEKQYNKALTYFQEAMAIYDGEWALQQRIDHILYELQRLEEAADMFGIRIGEKMDPEVSRLLLLIKEQAQADGYQLLNDQNPNDENETRNLLYLCLYDMLLLYRDFFQRIDKSCWKYLIVNLPLTVREELEILAPYIFNICCYLPRSVWALVASEFSLEQKPAFLKRWILHSYARLDFSLFHPDMNWDFEHYVELWHDGMEAYEQKEYEKALPSLQAAYKIYSSDRKLAEALAETYLATGNISAAKKCHIDGFHASELTRKKSSLFEMKSIIFEKEAKAGRIALLYEKCYTCLTQKEYRNLFRLSLAFWFRTKGAAMAQIFLLQSLFMQQKYRLLHYALFFCHTAKHDNFMGALLYAQMEQAEADAPFPFMVTERQLFQIRKMKSDLLTCGGLILIAGSALIALVYVLLYFLGFL